MTDSQSTTDGINRREYVAALVSAGAAGLAGCNSAGNDGDGGNDTTTPGGGNQSETTTALEPVSNTIVNSATTVPEQSQLNPWAAKVKANGWGFFKAQTLPTLWGEAPDRPDSKGQDYRLYSGHTWDLGERGEVSVATHLQDASVNPPYEWTHQFDDRFTYWDGTPIDAEAHRLHDRVDFAGSHLEKGKTFNHEVVDQWTYRSWRDKGEVEGQNAKPTNAPILRASIPTTVPFHPRYTRKWAQQYEDATTKDEVQSVTDRIKGVNITFHDARKQGLGSSVYRLESAEDISSQRIRAHRWDEHPNAENVTIDTLELKIATGSRFNVLTQQGKIDFHEGIVQQGSGTYTREQLPDHIQELSRFLRFNGNQLIHNWNNKHLARLWVRRAIVAAVDWGTVNVNGWGAAKTAPIEWDTGMMNFHSTRYFQKAFLDELHTWPRGSDMELAAEYMRKAGYTKQDGTWTDWNGDAVDLSFLVNNAISEYIPASQTIKANLEELGFGVSVTGVSWSSFTSNLKNHNYDIGLLWGTASRDIWDWYDTDGHWWAGRLVGGDPNDDSWNVDTEAMAQGTGQTADTHDDEGMPLQVQIPTTPGSIEAPERAGAAPDLKAAGIDAEEIDLAYLTNAFRREEATREKMIEWGKKCARFYNFYLPDFYFHQYTWGMWGNVRDFQWAERNHPAFQASDGTTGIDAYQALSGTVGTTGSTDYEKP